jgi:hypothetical protein
MELGPMTDSWEAVEEAKPPQSLAEARTVATNASKSGAALE